MLILDEPGHGLDQAAQKQFAKGLLRLKDRFETIIVCTHSSSVIESILSGETTWTVNEGKRSKSATDLRKDEVMADIEKDTSYGIDPLAITGHMLQDVAMSLDVFFNGLAKGAG